MTASNTSTPTPLALHRLIQASFKGRDRAYCPYSKFNVGAALLTQGGEMIIGCNIENASTPAGICAERTAMVKAISDGITSFTAVAVTSNLPTPTISPCGICRQFMREFIPLSTPIFMVSAAYPLSDDTVPRYIEDLTSHVRDRSKAGEGYGKSSEAGASWAEWVTVLSLGELLPMSFGPDQLWQGQRS